MPASNRTASRHRFWPGGTVSTLRWSCVCGLLLLAGCFNPANWDKDQVTKDMKEVWAKYNVTEIALTPVADGFEGTAKSTDGESFKVSLKKDVAAKAIRGTAKGDRGTELEYSASAK